MNKRDLYIIRHIVHAETLKAMNARACDRRVEWARSVTPHEFARETIRGRLP